MSGSTYYDDGVNSYTYEQAQSMSPPLIPNVYDVNNLDNSNGLSSPTSTFATATGLIKSSNFFSANSAFYRNFDLAIQYAYSSGDSPNDVHNPETPPDYNTLLDRMQYFFSQPAVHTNEFPTLSKINSGGTINTQTLTTALFNQYISALGSSGTPVYDAQGHITDITNLQGDLSLLNNIPGASTALVNKFYNEMNAAVNSLNVSTFQQLGIGSTLDVGTIFLSAIQQKIGNTLFSVQSNDIVVNDPSTGNPPQYLSSYQQIYFGFVPNATQDGFITSFNNFVNQEVSSNGSFNPSEDFADWVQQTLPPSVGTLPNLSASNNYAITGSSLDGNHSDSVLIVERILELLIKMISTLQNVGIAQANHLSFTTSYEQAYTGLEQQVPTYSLGQTGPNGKPLVISSSSSDTAQQNARNDINATINGNLVDNLRALNSLQQDSAKQQQSNINQTNDAVNNQVDMATTFIQQMNTLLTSVFS
jgi:hypothetical protein